VRRLVRGDYVLATKFSDGDPCDHFFVGFFRKMSNCGRYLVEDNEGKLPRSQGFGRCERISERVGRALCAIMPIIGDVRGRNVWWWRRHVKEMEMMILGNGAKEYCDKKQKKEDSLPLNAHNYEHRDSETLFGMVAFEEPGMPWTRVFGRVRLISLETDECFGEEPHWRIELDGKETHVPKSSVVVLLKEKLEVPK